MPPDYANGKICYIVIPATDIAVSAAFYKTVFGWRIRENGRGSTSFDDTVGQVSGTWVVGSPPQVPGIMVHIMVEDAVAIVELIEKNGGTIIKPIPADPPEITAHFKDPAGNIFGIYQERSMRRS